MSNMMKKDTGIKSQAKELADDPVEYFKYSYTKMHSIPRAELESLQLAALQYRFDNLYPAIPMLTKLADKQKIKAINEIEDVVPLMFEHTMYKSYPPSLLENGRFDQLTRWLDKLTSHDLSGVDASQCEGINDWVELLDQKTPMKISHSSGTTGVMSFIPQSKEEARLFGKTWAVNLMQEFGEIASKETFIKNVHVVIPGHRNGANGFARINDGLAEFIAGSEERFHTLYPGKMDSDVLFLAARIRVAKINGTLDSLKISPALLARQKEFEQSQANMSKDMDEFFHKLVKELAGECVLIVAPWKVTYDMALDGLKRGIKKVFHPDSVIVSGGGTKGLVRPDDWQDPILEFTGVRRMKSLYGMSEVAFSNIMCKQGHYHLAPWAIAYLLDPDTSKVLPRTGVVTGRAAFFDLSANSHWGGFITGDEITVHWDCDCPCGASTVYIEDNITRYSEKRGGDDKISCAATPDAHEEAMKFLVQQESKN